MSATTTQVEEAKVDATAKDIAALLKRARKGDESTVPALQRLLTDRNTVEQFGGDLARHVALSFIANVASDNNLLFREAMLRKLELLRADLAGPNPTPIEWLLVERVVGCWLQVQDADLRYSQAMPEARIAMSEHNQRRMDRAHRRYLSALKTLALVRKLVVPVLQVNIADKQQVNNNSMPIPSP